MYFQGCAHQTDRSIIIAGPTASGKSFLIDELKPFISKRRIVHREETEKRNFVPKNSIVHWPAAEKFPKNVDFKNVGVVIMLNKTWDDYCANVEARKHRTQYSQLGLETTYSNWRNYFSSHNLPIIEMKENNPDISKLVAKILVAMRVVILC